MLHRRALRALIATAALGDIAAIRPGIEGLRVGPVEVRDYNGSEVGR
jgi:hypothetical protein